jgi:hypothetical protein
MKKIMILVSCCMSVFCSKAGQAGTSVINQFDTVYYDLRNAVSTGNYLELPVFIKSDDLINSVDFSMKFDLLKLSYDSLVVLYPSMSPLASYNTNDSTLRLTSFDLQQIPNEVILVRVRFKVLTASQIKDTDFSALTALLNGDPCTPFMSRANPSTGIDDDNAEQHQFIHLFPNPANGIVNLSCPANTMIQIYNMNGQSVKEIQVDSLSGSMIKVEDLPQGEYLLRAITPFGNGVRKFTVMR